MDKYHYIFLLIGIYFWNTSSSGLTYVNRKGSANDINPFMGESTSVGAV